MECYVRMFLAHTDRKRFERILIAPGEYKYEAYRNLVDTFVQVDMCNSLSMVKDIRAMKKIRRLLKALNPDLVYCHSSKAGGLGRIANIGLGVPIVYNPHGWAFNIRGSKLKSWTYLLIEKALARFTTRFVVISNYERLSAVKHGITKEGKLKVIFNGIDLELLEKERKAGQISRRTLGIPDDAYLIGMVGRISAQKAPDVFVKVASRLARRIPDAFFMIVGDGGERGRIERMITDYGLSEKFVITGWVDNPAAYTNLLDQAVLLSRWEGFGLALAEYMKLGKPIVATDVDAIPELVTDYENGLLVEVDDDEGAARAIEEIYHDDGLKHKLVGNGLMRVEAFFNIERMANEHERLFMKMTCPDTEGR